MAVLHLVDDRRIMADRFRASQEGIEQALQRVMAGLAVFLLGATTAWTIDRGRGTPELLLLTTGILLMAMTVVRGWRTALTITDVRASFVGLVGVLVAEVLLDADGVGVTGGPGFALLTYAALLSALVLRWRAFLGAIASIVVVYVVGHAVRSGTDNWLNALDECASSLSTVVAGRLMLSAYRRSGKRADTAARTRFQVQQEDVASRVLADAAAERRRFIHDDVIAALVTIQHSTSDAVTLRAARNALQALRTSPADQPAAAAQWPYDADALLDGDFEVDLDDSGQLISQFPHIAAGVKTATQEALRNVQRHSGAHKARVRVASEDGVLTVTIRDDGRGFDPQQVRGFGIKESILARMVSLGGTAVIDSAPGSGTVVTLRWSDQPGRSVPGEPLPSVQATLRHPLLFTAQVTAATSVGQIWLMARHAESSTPWQAAVTLGALFLVLSAAVAVLAAKRALSHVHMTAIAAVWSVLLAAGLSLTPENALPTYDSWILGMACIIIVTLAPFVSFWSVTALAVTLAGVVAARVAVDPDELLSGAISSLLLPLVYALAIGAAAAGFRSASQRSSRLEAETGHAIVESAQALARQAAAEQLDLRTEPELKSFLALVVSGRVAPQAEDVRDRARVLALQTRDELYLPGVLDDDLRLLLATTRTTGARVTIHASDDTRPNDLAARILRATLDPSRVESATLTLPNRHFPLVRMVLVPSLTEERYRQLQADLVDLDPDIERLGSATVVTVRVGHFHDWSATSRPD